jgi:hypothetical protein
MSKFVTFNSIQDLLSFIESNRDEMPAGPEESLLSAEESDVLTAEDALKLAKAAATGAQNDIVITSQLSPVDLGGTAKFSLALEFMQILVDAKQRQAGIWVTIHDRLEGLESRREMKIRQAEYDAQVADIKASGDGEPVPDHPFDENLGESPEPKNTETLSDRLGDRPDLDALQAEADAKALRYSDEGDAR